MLTQQPAGAVPQDGHERVVNRVGLTKGNNGATVRDSVSSPPGVQAGFHPPRYGRTKGALSQDTARLMVFKLVMASAKTWRRLKGENQLPKVVQGVTFRNGVEVTDTPAQSAA